MGLCQEILGVLEGQAAHREVVWKPVEADMLMRQADLGLAGFCKEVDHDLKNPDPFLAEKISECLFVPVDKADLGDSSFLLQLSGGRLLRVFARFDVPLGKVPVPSLVMEQQVDRFRRPPEQNYPC